MSSVLRRAKRTSREAGKTVVQATGDGNRPVSPPAKSSGVRRTRPEFVPVGNEPERIREAQRGPLRASLKLGRDRRGPEPGCGVSAAASSACAPVGSACEAWLCRFLSFPLVNVINVFVFLFLKTQSCISVRF